MEPAVKPAAAISQRKVVGVLGTPATLAGELFLGTVERHAADVEVVRQPCPGLVDRIEAGALDGPETEALLRGFLRTPLAAGADVLVLACTHYPLLQRTIEALAGPGVHVIDPAPAVARQLGRCIEKLGSAAAPGTSVAVEPQRSVRAPDGGHEFRTTGDVQRFERVAGAILGRPVSASGARWENDDLVDAIAPVPSPSHER
jgi:glutamate racemase